MYIRCPKCGNGIFRITPDGRAVCVECGNEFEICAERVKPEPEPKPPEPLPPRKPEKYWFE